MSGLRKIFYALAIGAMAAALLVAPDCKRKREAENRAEREANSKRITADSRGDATEPIVDEALGFRLELPGPGWKLLREHDASRINADANAGALHSDSGTYGIIIVEPMPGTTLEQAVALVWNAELPGREVEIEYEKELEFQGVPARRRASKATIDGTRFRFVSTVLVRQDHIYQLMSWCLGSQVNPPLLGFHEAVELLEGEVKGRHSIRELVTHADGVGWRIREGRYESALSGLRLREPEGWRFVVGDETEKLDANAELALRNEDINGFVTLKVERGAKPKLKAIADRNQRAFEDSLWAPVGEPMIREIAGRRVELRRYHQAPFEHLYGAYIGDDAVTQLQIWYPAGLAESASGPVDALFPEFEQVPTSERAELHQALLDAPGSPRRFAANRAYRSGALFDFENRLRWTSPPGFWRVDSFDYALRNSESTVLLAMEAEFGVHAALEVFDAGTSEPAEILAATIESGEVRSRETLVVDGLTVHRARTIDKSVSPPITYAIAITRRKDRMISMITWSDDDSPAHQEVMEATLAGLDYDFNLDQTSVAGGVFTDALHGFSFDIPPGFEQPQTTDIGSLGQVVAWTKRNQELVLVVVPAYDDDEQWASSFVEQLVRDEIGTTSALGEPTRSKGKLGAHDGRRLSWSQAGRKLTADIIVSDAMVYCMLYGNLPDTQIETVRTSWALLE